ncbi:MAG: ComF family protein [Parvibaculum sp.]
MAQGDRILPTGQHLADAAMWLGSRLSRFFLPPLCLSCHCGITTQNALCATCWSQLHFIEKPLCPVSGLPFAFDPGPGMLSAAVIASPPPYDAARAVLRYDDVSGRIIHRYKYGDRMEAAPAMAAWMARAGADLLGDATLVAPVPLHRARLFSRRFNQSAELARHLGHRVRVAVVPDLLLRIKATQPQVGLSGQARRRNVAGAFKVNPRFSDKVVGKVVVLIDDVMTTGATIEACARVLKASGASEVRVLTFARVVPQGDTPI